MNDGAQKLAEGDTATIYQLKSTISVFMAYTPDLFSVKC